MLFCLYPVYSHARVIWSFSLHGGFLTQRHSGELNCGHRIFFSFRTNNPEKTFRENSNLFFVFICAVLWPSEAVWHACQTPARLHLPSSCSSEEGPSLYDYPAQLLGPPLGHQDLQSCHCFPYDGNLSVFMYVCVFVHLMNMKVWCQSIPTAPGLGPSVYSQVAGLYFHQERAELAGWPDARVEKEETGGCCTRGVVKGHCLEEHWYVQISATAANFSLPIGGTQYYCRRGRHCTSATWGTL